MKTVNIQEGGHTWEKQNIVTLFKAGVPYDLYKCTKCGLIGKSVQLGLITIRENDFKRAVRCKGIIAHKSLKVIHCNAVGEEFEGLVPESIHDIVEPPAGENNKRGEWVMGATEPVLLLFEEFEYSE